MKRVTYRNIVLMFLIAMAVALWTLYRIFFFPNIKIADGTYSLLIPEGSTFEQVCDSLESSGSVINMSSFRKMAKLRKYGDNVRSGRYSLENGMSNHALVIRLRGGIQAPVRLTFNNVRTIYELAGKVSGQIEADSASIVSFLTDEKNYISDGFNRNTIIAVFIPDTYEVYWNLSADELYKRMLKEYNKFWTEERKKKAAAYNLTPVEVSIVASIIDDEVAKNDEKPKIAGVYLNRLRIGMPLQACPTIKYALNDFTISRVLTEHIKVDSPYNTYMYRGLPPGPVRCATKSGIEAVLDASRHDYLYFAAKADFSGYHNFSTTLSQHNRYAAEYHAELNKRKIYR